MSYETYKNIKPIEEYFSVWDSENFANLTDELKKQIYERYVVKCNVFKRDGFRCQNDNCSNNNNELTLHHVKFKKNGGDDKVRNCITLCRSCHMGYHKRKAILVFSNDNLPSHIKGHTFQLLAEERLDWKQIKFEMSKLRKTLKGDYGIVLDGRIIQLLMKWLTMPYDEWDD